MRNIAGDLKHAVRLLVQSPAFTIAAVLTLALGIGANTAMFTLADATLLRPLQIREPDRLAVWTWSSAYPDFQEYQKHTDVFQGVAAVIRRRPAQRHRRRRLRSRSGGVRLGQRASTCFAVKAVAGRVIAARR